MNETDKKEVKQKTDRTAPDYDITKETKTLKELMKECEGESHQDSKEEK